MIHEHFWSMLPVSRSWPRRIARGGRVLAPGDPASHTQFIDVRDLASWLSDACHHGRGGGYNLTGTPVPFGILLDLCKTATYSGAELTWIPSQRLVAAGVDPGMGIPLWVAEPGYAAFNDVDSSRAVAAGLTFRPAIETIRNTLAWDLARDGRKVTAACDLCRCRGARAAGSVGMWCGVIGGKNERFAGKPGSRRRAGAAGRPARRHLSAVADMVPDLGRDE